MSKPLNLPGSAYGKLEQRFRRLSALQEAAGMLHWDMATMMPDGGRPARAEQLATLGVVCHEILTDAGDRRPAGRRRRRGAGLDAWQRANLAEMRRGYTHATALDVRPGRGDEQGRRPPARRCGARRGPRRDFAAVYPLLSEVLNLTRQAAAAKAEKLGCSPLRRADGRVRARRARGGYRRDLRRLRRLPAGLPRRACWSTRPAQRRRSQPKGPFPQRGAEGARQAPDAGRSASTSTHGRLDDSLHPFCGGVPDDVRITTRYSEDDFVQALMGVIHETGHALYERDLPADWRQQPVGQARGMSVHESQSLLMEMQAARSAQFCSYLAGLLRETFRGNDAAPGRRTTCSGSTAACSPASSASTPTR